jgi:hypothetical protein
MANIALGLVLHPVIIEASKVSTRSNLCDLLFSYFERLREEILAHAMGVLTPVSAHARIYPPSFLKIYFTRVWRVKQKFKKIFLR